MEKKKCLISKGNINKYIFFALLAGVSKCFVSTMLYVFGDYTNYNKHPIIIEEGKNFLFYYFVHF